VTPSFAEDVDNKAIKTVQNVNRVVQIETKKFALSNAQKSAPEAVCEDKDLIYKNCISQNIIIEQTIAQAQQQNKPVLITYGFEECPWCKNLHRLFYKGELMSFVEKEFVPVNINIKTSTGKEVFEKYKGEFKDSPNKVGFPFLVVLNAKSKKQTHIDTGNLEDNSKGKGHNIEKVKAALQTAHSKVK
jgi:hypothetical protein